MYADNELVAASKNISVTIKNDTKEISSEKSGTNKSYIVTKSSWGANITGLVTTLAESIFRFKLRRNVKIHFFDSTGVKYVGEAIAQEITLNTNEKNFSSYSLKLLGNSDLEEEEE